MGIQWWVIHKSDCLSANDLPPPKCPKYSVCYERANTFDIALVKRKEIL
ncbi:hypothetical protein AVBRAN12640_05535 [Campylobacter sp. RM12640]|nr:hypothetical protein [Campylobacter sp. RM12640]MBZ7989623.1 hypothetical protein [Campylobacter sp. RM12635]